MRGASVDKAWQVTTGRPDVDLGARLRDPLAARRCPTSSTSSSSTAASCRKPQGSRTLRQQRRRRLQRPGLRGRHARRATATANGAARPRGPDHARSPTARDDDHNGYVDDIAGWDFLDDDNDPFDDVRYGHGTGEAEDSSAEANNGGGVGTCPNCMVMPLRVGDSFVADVNRFAPAVGYAVDNGVVGRPGGARHARTTRASRATPSTTPTDHNVAVIASAADEEAKHHNYPSNYPRHDHRQLGRPSSTPARRRTPTCTSTAAPTTAATSPSRSPPRSCSSEATGKAAGMARAALLGRPQRRAAADRQRGPPAVHHERRRHRLPDGEATRARRELRHQRPAGREQALPLDPRLRRVLRLRPRERGPHGARGGQREHPARGRDHRSRLVHASSRPATAGSSCGAASTPAARAPTATRCRSGAGRSRTRAHPASARRTSRRSSPRCTRCARAAACTPPATACSARSRSRACARRSATRRRAGALDIPPGNGDPDKFSFTIRVRVRDDHGRTGEDRRSAFLHHDADAVPASRAACPPTARPRRGWRT